MIKIISFLIFFALLSFTITAQECDINNPSCPDFYTCQEVPETESSQCQIDCNTVCSGWQATDKQRGAQFYTQCYEEGTKTATCYCSIRGCERRSLTEGLIEGSIRTGEFDLDGKIKWIGKKQVEQNQPASESVEENQDEKLVKEETKELQELEQTMKTSETKSDFPEGENKGARNIYIILGIILALVIILFWLKSRKKRD